MTTRTFFLSYLGLLLAAAMAVAVDHGAMGLAKIFGGAGLVAILGATWSLR